MSIVYKKGVLTLFLLITLVIIVFSLILKLLNFKAEIMKNNYFLSFFSTLLIFFFSILNGQAPPAIIIDNTLQQEIFGLGGSQSGNVTLGLQNEELTGKTFTLNFSLPGDLTAGCTKKVTVTRDTNLEYVVFPNPYFPTAHLNPNENPKISNFLPGDVSQSFSLKYRFPAYTTCNGALGKLIVKIEITCNGQTEIYTKELTIIARAQNTWEVKHKSTYNTNRCGDYSVQCELILHTPNGQENYNTPYGVYSLTGEIIYNDPIITYWSGEETYTEQFNDLRTSYNSYGFFSSQYFCLDEAGGAPPNTTLTYEFTLGNSCMDFDGIINTTSINGNYTATIFDNLTITNNNLLIIPGQIQVYEITICNTGVLQNVDLLISGIFDTDKITILSVESDGYNSTVQPDGSYAISFEEIYFGYCKTIKFYFTATDNYSEGEYFQHCSLVNYLITPINNCESCNVEENGENFSKSICWTIGTPSEPYDGPDIKAQKCIVDPQIGYVVGDTINFRILVRNNGSQIGSANITDNLLSSAQNLTLVGTPTLLGYYSSASGCTSLGSSLSIDPTFSVQDNHVGTTLGWNIMNMPFDPSKVLVFEFSATVNPQVFGTKTNSVIGAGSNAKVSYDIYEYGELSIDKVADVEIANVGDTFTYTINVKNTGTMDLNNVVISDPLPSCVALAGTPTIVDNNGNTIPFTTNGNINFQITNTNLSIGDSFIIQIPVSKITAATCCNVATVTATVINFGSTITASHQDTPACVSNPAAPEVIVEKCIVNPQESYAQGDPIQFRILVKNTGNVAGNIKLIDQLQTSQQNINLTGTPTFGYYAAGDCTGLGSTLPIAIPFSITENHIGNTLDWNINSIPFDPAKVLVLEFSGTIANNSTADKVNNVRDDNGNIVATVKYETVRNGNCPDLDFKPFKPAVPNIFSLAVVTELNSGNDNIIDKEYGDFDNDGDIDILYTKFGQLHVLINNAGLGNAPVFNSTGTPLNLNFPAIGTHLNYPTSTTKAISYRLFDWDNDGDNDLIALSGREGRIGRLAGGVFLFHNDGTGHFTSPPVLLLNAMAFGDNFGFDASNEFPGEVNQLIEVGDLNGDNLPDILITGRMRITGIVYFENNGAGFDLVAPQIMAFPTMPSYFFNWIQNPLFPPHVNSFQVPELYAKDCSTKLNLFASDPLWYDSVNNDWGGGRMYFHENGGNPTTGIFPDFDRTGLTNQFGFNDDPNSNYPTTDFPGVQSPLRCDYVVTRFVDFLGNGCPIAIAYNYCNKQFIYYEQDCSSGTLASNNSVKSKSGITLYPNPTSNWVNFFVSKDLKINKITLFDSSGKLVLEPKISGTKINIENLIQGIYYVNFHSDKGMISEKLIVK